MAAKISKPRNISALRILFVDDNQQMRNVMKAMLHAIGIKNIRMATSVEEAMKAMHDFVPDIVITDLRMEPMDGLDLIHLLRQPESSPNTQIRIILLTGHSDKKYVLKARDAGVNAFLTKPVSVSVLNQRIAWLLDNPTLPKEAKTHTKGP